MGEAIVGPGRATLPDLNHDGDPDSNFMAVWVTPEIDPKMSVRRGFSDG
jgi:hypothetical protein